MSGAALRIALTLSLCITVTTGNIEATIAVAALLLAIALDDR